MLPPLVSLACTALSIALDSYKTLAIELNLVFEAFKCWFEEEEMLEDAKNDDCFEYMLSFSLWSLVWCCLGAVWSLG